MSEREKLEKLTKEELIAIVELQTSVTELLNQQAESLLKALREKGLVQ